jgi:hypothetical protein
VGNHDIKNEGLVRYESLLAPADYHFEWRSREFVFLNSAELELNGKQLQWFEELLAEGSPMVVFTHVPPEDPRGKNHGFVDAGAAQRFLRLVHGNSDQLRALFSGHVHIFDRSEKWGVPFVTSGGAGGPLYAAPKDGGFHHFTEVELSQAGLETTAVKVEAPGPPTDIVINGPEGDVVLPQSRLQELATVSGEAAFENRLDNIRGEGAYAGVPLSKLVALVGGMEENDTLVVQAVDGYQQHFSYCNVFPKNCGWADQQGQMILAVQFEGETVPEWETGYRIAFLPGDGVYDKEDCLQTSAPEQGCKVYDSAGARWVKNVVRLEVVK